jgi:hypothetical protein
MLSLTHENKKSECVMSAFDEELEAQCRYRDLQRARIVNSWQQLRQLQEFYGFPLGKLLGPNSRTWTVREIKHWLANRPTERKVIPRKKQKTEDEQLEDEQVNPRRAKEQLEDA